MGYLRNVIKGVTWMGAYRTFYRALGIARIAILARLLVPSEFGVVGIATLVLGFLEILTETGVNVFLIQESADMNEYVNTAWLVSILRGFLISFLLVIFAIPISNFFHVQEARNLLFLIALVPLVRGFINPSIVKLQKELEFSKEFFYRSLIFFVEVLVSVSLALVTRSAISLVLGLLISAIFEVVFTFIIALPRPKLAYEASKFKKVLNRGKWITGFGLFDYLYTQVDNLVVGRLLGPAALGIYDNAYTISTAPLTEIGDVFFRVTFPVFIKISDDKPRLRLAFTKNTIVNVLLMLPAGVLIYIFAEPLVNILLGPNWLTAVPVIKLLSVLGVVRGIANSTNSLLVAKKKQKYSALVTLVSMSVLLITIYPLVLRFGILGAGFSAILGTLFSLPFTLYFVSKTLNSS